MLKINKLTSAAILAASVFLLSGCVGAETPSETNTATSPSTGATDAQGLIKDSVLTVCSLSGKTKLTAEDIQAFRDQADRLEAYEGYNQKEMRNTAVKMRALADNYELIVGQELPAEAAQQFVDGCDEIKAAYEQAYGEKID